MKASWRRRRGPILFAAFVCAVAAGSVALVVTQTSDDDAPATVSTTASGLDQAASGPAGVDHGDDAGSGGPHTGGGAAGEARTASHGGDPRSQGQPPPGAEASGEPVRPEPLGEQPPPGSAAEESAPTRAPEIEPQPPQEHPDDSGAPTQLAPDEPAGPGPTTDRGKPGLDGSDEPTRRVSPPGIAPAPLP